MMEKPDVTTNYSVELLGGAVRRIGELEAEVWRLQAVVGDLIDRAARALAADEAR